MQQRVERDPVERNRARHGEHVIEHLLRRAGFGASEEEIGDYLELGNQVRGQIELLRQFALGNFRDLLVAIAKDTAMLVWLDGRTNIKGRPQENFARELMELFTMGVDTFAEADVYAGARVFTGWNLTRPSNAYYAFNYVAAQHDTTAKEFTFPIYANGSKVIPARSADAGMQDGIDLINAVAAHPLTGPRLARKLYQFFISEVSQPDPALVSELASVYYRNGFEMKPVAEHLLLSPQFGTPSNRYTRYSWPAEFVARSINENGSQGTDHGAASVMMAMGGSVRGGIFGTAPNLRITPDNPTLENSGNDVRYETDFRSVYAQVIDSWLGGDSVPVLGGNFKTGAPAIL